MTEGLSWTRGRPWAIRCVYLILLGVVVAPLGPIGVIAGTSFIALGFIVFVAIDRRVASYWRRRQPEDEF